VASPILLFPGEFHIFKNNITIIIYLGLYCLTPWCISDGCLKLCPFCGSDRLYSTCSQIRESSNLLQREFHSVFLVTGITIHRTIIKQSIQTLSYGQQYRKMGALVCFSPRNTDISVIAVTDGRAGRTRNACSIPGRGERLFSSPHPLCSIQNMQSIQPLATLKPDGTFPCGLAMKLATLRLTVPTTINRRGVIHPVRHAS